MKIKQNKAITLIALVITIIILLILAGVTIATLTGENGILNNAKNANERSIKAQLKEEIELEIMNIQIGEIQSGNNLTLEKLNIQLPKVINIMAELNGNEIIGEYKGYNYNIDNNFKVTIEDKVQGINFSWILNTQEYTKDNVILTINVSSINGEIVSIEVPDGIIKNNDGTYTISENGEYEITVKDITGATKINTINVNNIDKEKPKIEKIIGSTEMGVTGNITLSNIYDEGESGLSAIFISTNDTIPTLEDSGWISNTESSYVIQIVENGTYNVWVKDVAGNISDVKTCSVSGIVNAVNSIKVNDLEVEIGESAQLQVTTTPENNVEELIYKSSDENIATVDNTGKVTISQNATAGSTVTITVTGKVSTSVKGTCTVKVLEPTYLYKNGVENINFNPYTSYDTTYEKKSNGLYLNCYDIGTRSTSVVRYDTDTFSTVGYKKLVVEFEQLTSNTQYFDYWCRIYNSQGTVLDTKSFNGIFSSDNKTIEFDISNIDENVTLGIGIFSAPIDLVDVSDWNNANGYTGTSTGLITSVILY